MPTDLNGTNRPISVPTEKPKEFCKQVLKTKKVESERRRRKRVRRSKKNKNIYKSFVVYFVNIRGMRSKLESLEEITETVQPTIICLVETHLRTEEKVQIPGYKVYSNNRNGEGGGILVAVKDTLSNVVIEVKREMGQYETLWLKLDNTRQCIRLGVIYAPQEARSKEMYTSLEKEVREAESRQEKLMLVGDFNCKVGKQ